MKRFLIQLATAAIISLGHFVGSLSMAWPSYALRLFESDQSPLSGRFLGYHSSLVGALPMLGCLLGTPFGGIIGDIVGRKKTEVLFGLMAALSWALISFTSNINLLIAARFIGGFGSGVHTGIFTTLLGEITEPSNRGSLTSLTSFGYTLGMLSSYAMGWICSYNVTNISALSLSILFICLMCFVEETPSFLLRNGHETEAFKSFKFYRGVSGNTKETDAAFEEIKLLVNKPQSKKQEHESLKEPEKETLCQDKEPQGTKHIEKKENVWKQLWTSKSSRRGTILATSMIALSSSMGMAAVQTYAGPMFVKAVPTLSADMCSIALAVANLIGNGLPLIFADMIGRRVLLISSSTSVALCLAVMGSLLRWPIAPDWMFPVMILVYCFCTQLGVGCVPFIIVSEYFVPECGSAASVMGTLVTLVSVKTLATTISLSSMWLTNFVMLAMFGPVETAIGLDGTFFMFAFIATLTALISYIFLPETNGKTTADIQILLGSRLVHFKNKYNKI